MVGQTLFPHVHFYVIEKEGAPTIPVSFREVPGGPAGQPTRAPAKPLVPAEKPAATSG